MSDFRCELCGGTAHMTGSRIDGREKSVIVCLSCGMEVRREGKGAAASAARDWLQMQRIIKTVLDAGDVKEAQYAEVQEMREGNHIHPNAQDGQIHARGN